MFSIKLLVVLGYVSVLVEGEILVPAKTVIDSEYDPHPQYSYSYDVEDPFTGDSKSQVEHRDGDVVKGQYSLLDSDGTRRIVDYTADPINGFNAIVSKTPVAAAGALARLTPTVVAQQQQQPVLAAKPAVPIRTVAPYYYAYHHPRLAFYHPFYAAPIVKYY